MEGLRLSTWEIKVFCNLHTKCGKERLQRFQLHKFISFNGDQQMIQADNEEDPNKGDERLTRRAMLNH